MVERSRSKLSMLSDETVDSIDSSRPTPVYQLQPNIAYREPNIDGYHSRCSSARDCIFGSNTPSQVQITRNAIPRRGRPGRMTPTHRKGAGLNDVSIDEKSHCLWKDNPAEMKQPVSHSRTLQQNLRPTSQKERMNHEWKSMEETRALKRRAQVAPHRIDLPFYMSGLSAQLSPRYELDEKDIEKLCLFQSTHDMARDFSANRRNEERRRQINSSPIDRNSSAGKLKEISHSKDGRKYRNAMLDERPPAGRRQETKQSDENGNVPKEQSYIMSEEEKQKEELLLQYKGGKRITVGGYGSHGSAKDPFPLDALERELAAGNMGVLSILSEKQKGAFEDIFNDIDFDADGKVTFDELVFRLFSNVSKKDAKLLMKIFDVDRNKLIDRREFVTMCALNDRICGFRTESKYDCLRLDLENLSKYLSMYRAHFDLLDQDDDGKIHIDEVMLILSTAMGKEVGMNEDVAQTVIDSIDRDKNGFIDFLGFVMYVPFFLRLHNAMMNLKPVNLREIQKTKDVIHEQLRSRITSPST